ncbi:NOP14 [[Candida] subhashii]|uniref:NOP14 n=1 Tax=[Candida] subhashii TaxID=561895 RepID=A0A8J5QFH4_9ASCO|nr:NOP14 [[Candida] subhashii]KAG7660503.1 NOP14 [[Candida] subhashii]
MAGSQLKQLKAALKSKGLIGQTNTKSKKAKHSRSETKRDEKEKHINDIRDQFNKFDQRVNRTKHDVSIIQNGSFVKMGSKQHNATSQRNGAVQRTMKMQYELEKSKKGKTGGVLDKRFGENDSHLTKEEKMLARFTRERQGTSKKRNAFSLESDEEQDEEDFDGGFTLTHSGHELSLDDEQTVRYVDEDSLAPADEEGQPPRKKSKKEVMKEVIAKSKFYKQQRQKEFAKTQDDIADLDEEFGDVMDDLRGIQTKQQSIFSTKTPESIEYDAKVRELTYERRAVPADKTKTEEEIRKEHEDKMKKLEADRLRRMEGFVEERDVVADDLDDEFWNAGSDENEEEGFTIKESDNEEEEDLSEEEGGDEPTGRPKRAKTDAVVMPSTHAEFLDAHASLDSSKHSAHIMKICETYRPNLAMGNKEKMNNFVGILFQHALYLADESKDFEPIVKIIKKLAETYNQTLVETVREEINEIQTRIDKQDLQMRDLVFFVIVGFLFSTSDHYHLIVTPCLILMNEILSSVIFHPKNIQTVGQGIFIVDVLLSYQRFAKRFDPEIVNFIEQATLMLIPEPEKLQGKDKLLSSTKLQEAFSLSKSAKIQLESLSVSQLFSTENDIKSQLLVKLVSIMDKLVALWKEKSCLVEILESFIPILKHLVKYFASTMPQLADILTRFTRMHKNIAAQRKPLTLQQHRAIAIQTLAPKFEENFNPDKKSYDVNRERQELNKVKHQLKMERKAALKDIRQENKFVAREQIGEKKKMYEEYHRKMANIVNSISTVEGAEKNQYEREKKQRKGGR